MQHYQIIEKIQDNLNRIIQLDAKNFGKPKGFDADEIKRLSQENFELNKKLKPLNC